MSGRRNVAFTLIEVVVALGVLAILASLLIPAVQSAREAGRDLECRNHLRQIGIASHTLESNYRRLPRGSANAPPTAPHYDRDHGWLTELLPSLEPVLADQYNWDTYAFSAVNEPVYSASLPILQCPSNEAAFRGSPVGSAYGRPGTSPGVLAAGDYQGNAGFYDPNFLVEQRRGPIRSHVPGVTDASGAVSRIQDGRSNTILAWESTSSHLFTRALRGMEQESWPAYFERAYDDIYTLGGLDYTVRYYPHSPADAMSYFRGWPGGSMAMLYFFDPTGSTKGSFVDFPSVFNRSTNVTNRFGQPFSFHPSSINVLMVDGSVRRLHDSTEARIIADMCSVNGG